MFKIVRSKRGFIYAQNLETGDYWNIIIRNAPKGLRDGDYAKYENRTMYYPFSENAMDEIFKGWRDFPEIIKKRAFMFGEILISNPELV